MSDSWSACAQVCVCARAWTGGVINRLPHPFRSSHPLYPGGKRREPCKGISLYSSLPALPFLFSLFPNTIQSSQREKETALNLQKQAPRERGDTESNNMKQATRERGDTEPNNMKHTTY